ncbi:LLM class flavin-dependent oxidoreductase [Ramlibacter sp. 2FC]|uniref:LLM class flavin-dependent oxidoreductase n=1 Tax=Ramlibacter sp. 2FC TaxID=2502188 RepID=UPI0010F57949|nr:LLM class flavin-dependent oxidoreductase [Ramlibacter sp. 2FC]
MKLGFFTMPMHPIGKDWQLSLKEDREAFILADQLGFVEGYVGEHATDPEENITSSAMFIATLVDATRNMKLGTGTTNMPNQHPAAIASNIAMLDHLLGGRFILGISPGALPSDAEVFGNMDLPRPAMFLESINHVIKLWTTQPPYDLKGDFWNISTARTHIPETGMGTIPLPLQRPHPPIVVTAVAPFSQGIAEAAARGWDPISANFLLPMWVKTHWTKYVEGCARINRTPDPANWRVAKTVFVAKDDATARAYAMGSDGPYYYYYRALFNKLKRRGALGVFKSDPKMPDEAVTLEDVMEKLVIHGSPAKVADKLHTLKQETGEFGTLLYAGVDWKDPALARDSMVLMAEKVLPLMNA